MTPDFEYFIRMKNVSRYSHTPIGLFWFDLPLALLLCFIYHLIVRNSLFDNLPAYLKEKLIIYKDFQWLKYFQARWAIVLISGMTAWALAQAQTVERAAKGQPGQDIQVGAYINVQPDCSSGPLPTIRLAEPPAHGKITVKKAKANAMNYKQCLAIEVPAYVAFYRSVANFNGTDLLTLEVKYPGGRTETQKITVSIGTGTPGQRI